MSRLTFHDFYRLISLSFPGILLQGFFSSIEDDLMTIPFSKQNWLMAEGLAVPNGKVMLTNPVRFHRVIFL